MNVPTLATPAATSALHDGSSLICDTPFRRMAARIAAEHPELSAGMPERILDQALAFLAAAAVTARPLSPSALVDIGWHTFILYTSDYREFCDRVAGQFIDHVPDDDPETEHLATPPAVSEVMIAITDAGFQVDNELWPAMAECSQCHQGCHDGPVKLVS
jgi:hypothetical protein